MISFSSACGVISIQSDAQRSVPKMPILLAANQAPRSGVSAKPGKRKNGACEFQRRQVLGLAGAEIRAIGRLLHRDHAAQDIRPRRAVCPYSAWSAADGCRCDGRRYAPRRLRGARDRASPRPCARCRRRSRARIRAPAPPGSAASSPIPARRRKSGSLHDRRAGRFLG